ARFQTAFSRAVVHGIMKNRAAGPLVAIPQARGGVFSIVSQRVEADVELGQAALVVIEIARNTAQRFETCLFRMHTVAHRLDNRMAAHDANILLAASRRSGASDVLIEIQTRADEWGVADAPRNFPGQTTGSGHARHLAFGVESHAID